MRYGGYTRPVANVYYYTLRLAPKAGKTVVFCEMVKRAADKGTRVLITVRGIKLVEQASERLRREGVGHGVLQGNNSTGIHHDTLVTSIDTLYARRLAPEADFVVVDEGHLSSGAAFKWFLEQYKGKFILAVSATPHLKSGMRHIADAIVYPISMKQLIDQGYLCPLRYFAPTEIDLSQVNISRSFDDYVERELEDVMTKPKIMGDIVKNWIEKGENRPTLLFCATIKQSKKMREEFASAGIRAEHIDANTPKAVRNDRINRLVSGEINIITNVNVLSVGVDIPDLSCIISARPTRSYNLWIQQLGRGTRIASGKTDTLVFDHANNTMEHGFIEDEKICELDGREEASTKDCSLERAVRCEACFAMYPWKGNGAVCPCCGNKNTKNVDRTPLNDKKAILSEIKLEPWEIELNRLIATARARRLRKGFIYYKMKEKYGEQIAERAWARVKVIRGWPKKEAAHKTPSTNPFSTKS